jgi:hypothetical protein
MKFRIQSKMLTSFIIGICTFWRLYSILEAWFIDLELCLHDLNIACGCMKWLQWHLSLDYSHIEELFWRYGSNHCLLNALIINGKTLSVFLQNYMWIGSKPIIVWMSIKLLLNPKGSTFCYDILSLQFMLNLLS